MIKFLNDDFTRQGNLKKTITAKRTEELNGENTLDFTAIIDEKSYMLLNPMSMFELDDDYFMTAYFETKANGDGTFLIDVESEHISYSLNDPMYNVEYFTEIGTPTYILGKILDGTQFTVGTVEFDQEVTYSAQEAKSRRQLLMEFVAYIGGEISFSKFEISIVAHRGSKDVIPLIQGKNVNVIGVKYDKREKDKDGNPLVSYKCSPVLVPGTNYSLGDEVLVIQHDMNIREELRLVKKTYNPYDISDVELTFSNYTNGLSDGLYQIQTTTVSKDKIYNGCRIGPEFGFEAVRSDKKARAYFRSDRMAFQSGDGTGENWIDRLYYDYDSELDETVLVFDGKFSVNAIDAIKSNIDFIVNNTFITQNLYADYGRIAKLSVSELNTSWKKITNYLLGDSSDVNYIHIYENHMEWITASTPGTLTTHLTNGDGEYLYWRDDTHTGMTLTDTGYPVLIYAYVETVKFDMTFESEDPQAVKMTFGAGFGYTNPDEGKGFLYKDATGLLMKYVQAGGNVLELRLGDDGIRQVGNNASNGIRNIYMNTDPPENPQNNDIWIDTDSNEFEESLLSKVIKVGGEQNIRMQIWAGNLEIFIDGAEEPTWYIPLTPIE